MTFALIKNPAYSRVSFTGSNTLAINELKLCTNFENIRMQELGGIPHILFDSQSPLTAGEVQMLSRLSFVYAIFEIIDNELLKPINLAANFFLDQELSAILKYSGKTNELFTRLMINLAQLYNQNPHETLNILDPLAGKGTTLYESIMQGHNAYGVEIDEKMPHESIVYLKKYLETAKIKHENHAEKTSGQTEYGKFTSLRSQIKIARTKTDKIHFEMVAGDTRNVASFFRKNFFHAIVADLPYGVHHGSKTNKKPQSSAITRNAMGLISEAMPGWVRVLKPGGVIVLAWNLFLISKAEMSELLGNHGFVVPNPGVDLSHRVDQAIDRDLIIGIKN